MAKVITSNPKYYPLDWDVCTPEMVIPKINYYKQRLRDWMDRRLEADGEEPALELDGRKFLKKHENGDTHAGMSESYRSMLSDSSII